MSRDSHGNPSQPHCVSVSWLVFFVYTDFLFAGAAKLKEFTQSLNGWEVP